MEGRPHNLLTLGQERFVLSLVAVAALLVAMAGVIELTSEGPLQTALLVLIGSNFGDPLKSVFRHYFPGGRPTPADPPNG